MNAHVPAPPLIVLFDGDCGLCAASARWIERRVDAVRLEARPLGAATTDPRVGDAVRGLDLASSLHVVRPDGSVRTGAAAVLEAGRLVPRWGIVARLLDHRAGRLALEPGYRLVARNRHRIGRALGLPSACALPGGGASR
ncbi:MAG TPA: DUF393 domain-containing protein [Candidatus Limnocylindrales bacterium]|nr:DUF393 domain-containing protein [Candidatus Limnocylindrales bacterium]